MDLGEIFGKFIKASFYTYKGKRGEWVHGGKYILWNGQTMTKERFEKAVDEYYQTSAENISNSIK